MNIPSLRQPVGALPPAPLRHEQLERLAALGKVLEVEAGDVLFTAGDAFYDLFVVLEGAAHIIGPMGGLTHQVIAAYGPSEFLGEIGMLTGERLRYTGVVGGRGRVLRVPRSAVRRMMAQDAELSESLLRAFLDRRANLQRRGAGVLLVGSRFDAKTRSLVELLARGRVAHGWIDLEGDPGAEEVLQELNVPVSDLPLVLIPGRPLLRNPGPAQVREEFDVKTLDDETQRDACDLLIVGGGPGGLAAAVYGASEGLRTTLLDASAFGGQAGASSRIENYLGFPAGLSGAELAARSVIQAEKFGAVLHRESRAAFLATVCGVHKVTCEDGSSYVGRNLIISTGAQYRRLPVPGMERYEGSSVHYEATVAEARHCLDQPVAVIGGANSAGQAALFLARTSSPVHLLVRGSDLAQSMSRYLIDAIESSPTITVRLRTEVVGVRGDDRISGLQVIDRSCGRETELTTCAAFVFIGADPCTGWLGGQLATDANGFLLTGRDLSDFPDAPRDPFPWETSTPGVFCVGDVRSGSVKRVASAVGEGSAAVRLVFDRMRADHAHAG
jgi:thioredoxin reductase (NADPH)